MRSADGMFIRLIASLVAGLVVSVCACNKGSRFGRGNDFRPVEPPQNEIVQLGDVTPIPASDPYSPMESYPLRPGDEIQFTLSVDPQPREGSYRIMVNDQLVVEYLHDPTPDRRLRTMRVLPNGTIDLPLIGSVVVVGKTVDEVKRDINNRATKFYKFPQIAITVGETSPRAEELRRTFSSGFTNQTLTIVVNPDGTINLPEIGTLQVFEWTVPQLRDEANRRYAERVPGVHVWPDLTKRAPDQIYVLGQVQNPGRYLVDRPTHVSQAIAQAGGWLLGAELREVVLIRYHERQPESVLLDIHSAIRHDLRPRCVDLTDDLLLADGDVIVIPRDTEQNTIDMIRRVFTEGVYGVIPVPSLHAK